MRMKARMGTNASRKKMPSLFRNCMNARSGEVCCKERAEIQEETVTIRPRRREIVPARSEWGRDGLGSFLLGRRTGLRADA